MAKARANDPARTIDELHDAVERLNQRIEILTQAIDELQDEVRWSNNERPAGRAELAPPFILRSMPIDPTTDDWHLNRVPPEEVDAIRNAIAPSAAAGPAPAPVVDSTAGQAPDLRQILAAFILLSSDSCAEHVEEVYDWLLVWACHEFDVELLQQSLPDYVIADHEHEDTPRPPPERQHQLFADEVAADQRSDEAPIDEDSP